MLQKIVLILFFILNLSILRGQPTEALPNGHAHNDYAKPWPALTTALSKGFVSVEIDVFPFQEKLSVAHVGLFLGAAPEIEALYFEPLENWLEKYGQLFLNPEQRLTFMIDIKRNPKITYILLRKLCEKYKHLITHYYPEKDSVVYGVLDILLSGHKPYQEVMDDSVQYMLIDGGLGEINHPYRTAKVVPRVSARYGSLFKWNGRGKMPPKELMHLREIVSKAHVNQQKVRFWGMPNKIAVWKLLLQEGVDWMNVDDLEKYSVFCKSYELKRE